MNNSLRRILRVAVRAVGTLLVLWFFVGLWSMSGSHAYHQQALAYIEGAQNALIAHGLCQDRNDCVKRQMLFGSGGAVKVGPLEFGGVEISVYGVASTEVVGDLVKAAGEVYKKQKGPRLTMHVYESRHQQSKIRFASVEIE
jgi:hypothetical protein